MRSARRWRVRSISVASPKPVTTSAAPPLRSSSAIPSPMPVPSNNSGTKLGLFKVRHFYLKRSLFFPGKHKFNNFSYKCITLSGTRDECSAPAETEVKTGTVRRPGGKGAREVPAY